MSPPTHEAAFLDALMPRGLGASSFTDWQFYVATAIFLFAAAWLLRGVLPIPFLSRRHRAAKKSRSVKLTIGGKPLK